MDQRFDSDRKDDHPGSSVLRPRSPIWISNTETEVLLKKELEWFAACIELEEHFDYYFYQGMVLYFPERTG